MYRESLILPVRGQKYVLGPGQIDRIAAVSSKISSGGNSWAHFVTTSPTTTLFVDALRWKTGVRRAPKASRPQVSTVLVRHRRAQNVNPTCRETSVRLKGQTRRFLAPKLLPPESGLLGALLSLIYSLDPCGHCPVLKSSPNGLTEPEWRVELNHHTGPCTPDRFAKGCSKPQRCIAGSGYASHL